MKKLPAKPMDLYNKIKEQRSTFEAPVDTLGCACVGEGLGGDNKKYQVLVALLLSSQTKDEITHAAVRQLNAKLGLLTPQNVLAAPEDLVHDAIRAVGYHNKKLKYLINLSRRVDAAGMPTTLAECLKLPGVGRKMAYLYLQHACGSSEGIGVDTHVFRISKRIGLSSGASVEKVRADLESIFEPSEWEELNRVLVGFGQSVCNAVKPKCHGCSVKDECPSSILKQASNRKENILN